MSAAGNGRLHSFRVEINNLWWRQGAGHRCGKELGQCGRNEAAQRFAKCAGGWCDGQLGRVFGGLDDDLRVELTKGNGVVIGLVIGFALSQHTGGNGFLTAHFQGKQGCRRNDNQAQDDGRNKKKSNADFGNFVWLFRHSLHPVAGHRRKCCRCLTGC